MGSHSVTCHPTQVNMPRLTPAMQAGTRFTYSGGMEGWVDLVDLIAPQPGDEPASFRSRVRRPTTAPPRQQSSTDGRRWYVWVQCRPVFVVLCARVRWSWSQKLHYMKKNVRKSLIGNWKLEPVIGNFTGYWLVHKFDLDLCDAIDRQHGNKAWTWDSGEQWLRWRWHGRWLSQRWCLGVESREFQDSTDRRRGRLLGRIFQPVNRVEVCQHTAASHWTSQTTCPWKSKLIIYSVL